MTLPKENLDSKTYEDLVKEAVSRIPIYAPEWTDHNVHDPGRTFIELFAWLAEMQIYNLNRITDMSRRKFLKLMGITELRPAKAATVDVTFSLLTSTGTPTCINRGTIVTASDPVSGEDILFETQQDLMVVDAELTKILVHAKDQNNRNYIDRSEANKNENVYYYAFRSKPQKGDELYLGFDNDPGNDITLAFSLFKDGLAERGMESQLFPSGKVKWKCWDGSDWQSVEELNDKTNHPSSSGTIRIGITGPMAKKNVDGYLFSWDDIPGNDSVRLIDFLKQNYDIDWVKTAKIEKIDDVKTIKISTEKKYLSLKLNDEQTEVNLEIDDIRTDKFVVKIENSKLNIYVEYFWLRCVVEEGTYDIPPKIDRICLNTAHAVQRSRVKEDRFSGSGLPDFSFDIKHLPVLDFWQDDERPGITVWTYLFSWGDLPGNDNERLREFLKQNFGIDWGKTAKIKKIDNGKTIKISTQKNYLSFKLNDEQSEVNLEIDDVRTDKFVVKIENNTLKIYDEWIKIEDFDASTPGDKHYTMDLKSGRVTFGDGIHGKIPQEGENNILVTYRTGGGVRGNVNAGAINRVDDDLAAEMSVTNHRPASGGEDAETLEEAIQRARMDLKTPYRAVTSHDYERLAMTTPGVRVARAKALPGYYPGKDSPVQGIVSVIAVPQVEDDNVNPEPSQGFMNTVYEHLDKRRLLTTELFVLRPVYEEICVKATVWIHPRYVGSTVADEVKNKLNDFLHPTKGGPDGTGWPFGRSVYRSEIYEVIDRVEGVDHVTSVSLNDLNDINITIPPHSLVYSGIHQITPVDEGESVDG